MLIHLRAFLLPDFSSLLPDKGLITQLFPSLCSADKGGTNKAANL